MPADARRSTPARALPQPEARILLVDPDGRFAPGIARELSARGLEARSTGDVLEALRRARAGEADVVVLGLPLRGADDALYLATLKEGPAPPRVLVLDPDGRGVRIETALPGELRPDRIVAAASDLVSELVELLGRGGRRAPAPSFAHLLAGFARRGETGALVVEAEGVRTTVHLREGRVVFAEGGILRDTLGRMLLRRGRLREDQYLAVIERMSRSETSIRVGEVLIELGILSPREVYEALKLQVREKVVACFEWRTFEANFRRGEALPPHATSFECPPVEALILTGMRAHFDADRLEPVLAPHAHRHAALRDSPRHVAERFHMDPGEQRLLLAISGERSLASLTDEGRLDPLATKRVLAALLVTGSLELLDAPRSLAGAGVSSARSADPAQAAAPASAGSADGDSGARARARPGLRAPAASSPPPRPGPARELDPKQAGLEAEHAFGQGRRFLRENLPAQALAELRRAAELQPHEAEYQMYAAWAAAPLERDEGAKLLARATARAFAVRVLRQDRGHARAHAILGQLLYEEDEREAAERHFRIAVQSDPEELEAQRWLRHMERKRPRKRGTGH